MQQQFFILNKYALNLRHMLTSIMTGIGTSTESESPAVSWKFTEHFRLSVQQGSYIVVVLVAVVEKDNKVLLGNANKLQIHLVDRLKCKLSISFNSCFSNSLAQIFIFFCFPVFKYDY